MNIIVRNNLFAFILPKHALTFHDKYFSKFIVQRLNANLFILLTTITYKFKLNVKLVIKMMMAKIFGVIIFFAIFVQPVISQTAYDWNEEGNRLYDLGEYNKAIEAYNRATAIDSNFESAKENRDRLITKMPRQTPYTTPFQTPYTMPSTTPSPMPYIVISGIGMIIGLIIVVKAYRLDKQRPEP